MNVAPFPTKEIGPGAVLVTAAGKLRGSAARHLGDHLARLAEQGVGRVVLDLRGLGSIDSLGTLALEEGVDRGLRVHVVVAPAFEFDQFFASRSLIRRGLVVHRSLEDALGRVRQIVDSGLALV